MDAGVCTCDSTCATGMGGCGNILAAPQGVITMSTASEDDCLAYHRTCVPPGTPLVDMGYLNVCQTASAPDTGNFWVL